MQVGDRRAAAHTAALRDLVAPDTFLVRVVEVRVLLVPGLLCGLDKRFGKRMTRAALGNGQRPADAVERVRAALVVLRTLEMREDVVVTPAFSAVGGPFVVVGSIAADVDHRVHRAAPAEDLAARHVHVAAAEPGLRLAREVPVVAALEQPAERDGDVDLVRRVRSAGLDQRNLHVWILAQARGEHAARRASSNDHVVVHAFLPVCFGDVKFREEPRPREGDAGRGLFGDRGRP